MKQEVVCIDFEKALEKWSISLQDFHERGR